MDVDRITIDKSTRSKQHILFRMIIMSIVHLIVIKVKVTRYAFVRNSERERENEKEYSFLSFFIFKIEKYNTSI
jgi:hypothetical protein